MKKLLLWVLTSFVVITSYSQTTTQSTTTTTTDRYTVSGGLLGAVNFSQFRLKGDNPLNIDYEMETGWGAGLWLNLPITNWFSLEPQVQYNSLRYNSESTSPTLLLNDGKVRYITVPLLLKFHLGDKFALTAGPQVDFVTKVTDETNVAEEDDFNQTSFSAFGGFEILPHGRVTIFGRYIHGFSNMDDRGTAGSTEFRNQVIQGGLKLRLFGGGKKGIATTTTTTVVSDRDGDGINDDVDKCPDQPGTAKYNGCPIPDSDGDGINDEEDKCPNQAGIAKYNGCPIPDSDGDGINDEQDKCPNQPGPADRNGCPATDRDNDGVNDDDDRCPDIAGTVANKGCPDVPDNVGKSLSASAQKISFGTGTNNVKLTTASNTSLNQVVKMMNENPGLRVRIEAHTDNVGNDDTNMKLSEDRANAVKDYLVNKGISADRITAQGFGETMPIADNNTASGRTRNRRVEIKVDYQ